MAADSVSLSLSLFLSPGLECGGFTPLSLSLSLSLSVSLSLSRSLSLSLSFFRQGYGEEEFPLRRAHCAPPTVAGANRGKLT